jgi:hypothetical protein
MENGGFNAKFPETTEGKKTIGLRSILWEEVARDKGFTYYGYMNVTLSLPEDLVKRVRKIAVDRDTTLTGLVREYLNELSRQDSAAGRKRREREALERGFAQFQIKVGKKTWKREDLHERG